MVDLFFGTIDGNRMANPIFAPFPFSFYCSFPASGFQYVDFKGEPVLAPIDQVRITAMPVYMTAPLPTVSLWM
jgi:hypothetical protein